MRIISAALFGFAGVAIVAWLGVWQLQRLDWKQGVLDDIEARIAAAPVRVLPATPDPVADRYLPVELDGVIGATELHVLVSRKDLGAGYRIITAFETGGRRVLLDRGFVRDEFRDKARSCGAATVTGNLHWPDDRLGTTPPNDLAANIWFARDLADMARILETEPLLIVARSDTGQGIEPFPVSTEGIPNNHLNYAITWFSLAIAWLGMTVFLLWRISRRT